MDLIECVSPINEKDKKNKSGYRISDSATRFYYRYVFRSLSALNIIDGHDFFDRIIKDDYEAFLVPKVFETISKQFLTRMNMAGKLNLLLIDIGTYWYDNPKEKKNGQFDVVGRSKDGYIFYEVKLTSSKMNDKDINDEVAQARQTTLHPIQFGFVSKSGFELASEYPCQFYSIDDLFLPLSR